MKDRKEDEKREKTINKIKQLVGEEKEENPKQNTTAVFWPKVKNGLFLVAAAESEDDVEECVSGGETEDEDVILFNYITHINIYHVMNIE